MPFPLIAGSENYQSLFVDELSVDHMIGSYSVGGSDKSIQYNKNNSFGGDLNLTWDYTNNILQVPTINSTSTTQ